MSRVAVLGSAVLPPREAPGLQPEEMVFRVCREALRRAGLSRDRLETVVQCSMDMFDGRIISSSPSIEPSGAYLRDESKVAGDGLLALLYAWMRVRSGVFRTALVVAQCKPSETDPEAVYRTMFDPWYTRPLGLDRISAAALQARRCMDTGGVTREEMARIVADRRSRGARNPRLRSPRVSRQQVLGSRPLALPLRALDASPLVDSAAAVVIASEETARGHPHPVWISGGGHCVEASHLGDRPLDRSPALEDAARRAFHMAGTGPRGVDVAEVHAEFSHQVPLWSGGGGGGG
ncbi:MAG: thiolase family protein, partial [Euryarchaeota archaeon]|nr:thiolase family protein [Euryarchaeota archaeon]